MIIIGERINSSIPKIKELMERRDLDGLRAEATLQAAAGADYLDVNASELRDEEPAMLTRIVPLLQEASGLPLAIDSPSPQALAAGLAVHQGRALLNSITAESGRYEGVMPLVAEFKPRVVALCLDDQGMPKTPDDRVRVAGRLVAGLTGAGIDEDDIFLDPLVKPIAVDPECGHELLDSIAALRREFPRCHITLGLSNVSFGMPKGRWLNRALLVLAMARGLDSCFCDPADGPLLPLVRACRVLLGQDEFAGEYLAAARAGRLEY